MGGAAALYARGLHTTFVFVLFSNASLEAVGGPAGGLRVFLSRRKITHHPVSQGPRGTPRDPLYRTPKDLRSRCGGAETESRSVHHFCLSYFFGVPL